MTRVLICLTVAALAISASKDLRLVEAVKNRDARAVRTLAGKVDVNATQPDGATALAWAVHLGDRNTVELLLKAGADVNAADENGETPLTLACANGDAPTVKTLLFSRRQMERSALERRDGPDVGGGRGKRGSRRVVGGSRSGRRRLRYARDRPH